MNVGTSPPMTRTSGDGMEQKDVSKQEKQSVANISLHKKETEVTSKSSKAGTIAKKPRKIPGEHSIYRPDEATECFLKPELPKGKLIQLVPKLAVKKTDPQNSTHKEPRFIPFEPYKAAVTRMVPPKKKVIHRNKNHLDISVLVKQMSMMKSSELKSREETSENLETKTESEMEKEALQREIEELKKQHDSVTAQLKFQVQVNSELKNLLVAAVGEDMQTRVNGLTEDKLQLARALLDTANNLSTHTEQIEYLAGQSEVWRSKFLASSVMVEELARWKADLSQKNSLLTKSNKQMLHLLSQIREMILDLLKNLKFLARVKSLNIPTSNALDLTAECLNISQQMVLHSGIGMPESLELDSLNSLTEAEALALESLKNSSQPLMSTDEAFKAIVEQAFYPAKNMNKLDSSVEQTESQNAH